MTERRSRLLALALAGLLSACASSRFGAVPPRGEGETIPGALVAPADELWFVERDDELARAELALTLGLPANVELPEIGALVGPARGANEARVVLPASTRVDADVAGCAATVRVRQSFATDELGPGDAAYVLPLARGAAVHDFTMRVGARTIRGVVRERGEAERLYAAALSQGRRAALLTAERAGVFLQRLAGVERGATIDVDVRYAADVAWKDGWRALVLPAASPSGAGAVDVSLALDAGVAIERFECRATDARVDELAPSRRSVRVEAAPGTLDRPLAVRWRAARSSALAGSIVAREDGWLELALDPCERALDDVRVDWGGLDVEELEPSTLHSVVAGRPERVVARLRASESKLSSATVRITALADGRDVELVLPVSVERASSEPLALAWARARIARLDRAERAGLADARRELVRVALEHGLATPFTSLVAIDALAPSPRAGAPNAAGRTTP